jgi:glycosyltransferase involved in cell wall biosynthesis
MFGIVMATYFRKSNKTKEYLQRSLTSIINQTFLDWQLIIIGDKYEPEEELLEIINEFKQKTSNKIIYLQNTNVERDFIKNKNNLWNVAGATSINMGLNYLRENNIKYYCHLDDDDYWTNTHLEALNEIYSKYENCIFANTQATHPKHKYLPKSNNIIINENNIVPEAGKIIHSSYSFRCDIIKLDYYTTFDKNAYFYPSDAIMLNNIRQFLSENKQYCSIYNPILTCFHDIQGEAKR